MPSMLLSPMIPCACLFDCHREISHIVCCRWKFQRRICGEKKNWFCELSSSNIDMVAQRWSGASREWVDGSIELWDSVILPFHSIFYRWRSRLINHSLSRCPSFYTTSQIVSTQEITAAYRVAQSKFQFYFKINFLFGCQIFLCTRFVDTNVKGKITSQ